MKSLRLESKRSEGMSFAEEQTQSFIGYDIFIASYLFVIEFKFL
jgi:hypothetical protein